MQYGLEGRAAPERGRARPVIVRGAAEAVDEQSYARRKL
jgi:hypothetical protein